MRYRRVLVWWLASMIVPALAKAELRPDHGEHEGRGEGGESRARFGDGALTMPLGAVSGGYRYTGVPYFVTVGPDGGPIIFTPPWMLPRLPVVPVIIRDPGVLGGPMPPRPAAPVAPAPQPRPRRVDPAKAGQLVTIGDRLFRAGNVKRASERYDQAVRADPDAASPRVRRAQIAIVRGQYAEAAECLRGAIDAEPAWLLNAPDIQSIFGEPTEFARQIGRIESHVQAEPGDRDAWLVLGAEFYLSGQTRRAADVFLRLTDRKPDPTLAAFLEACTVPERDQK